MVTTRPQPRSAIGGTSACSNSSVDRRLTAICRSKCVAADGLPVFGNSIEAFSTRMSIGAQAVTAAARRVPASSWAKSWANAGGLAAGLRSSRRRRRRRGFLRGAGMVDGEARADAGEAQRDGAADFAACAGDQGGAAIQAECVERIGLHGLILCSGISGVIGTDSPVVGKRARAMIRLRACPVRTERGTPPCSDRARVARQAASSDVLAPASLLADCCRAASAPRDDTGSVRLSLARPPARFARRMRAALKNGMQSISPIVREEDIAYGPRAVSGCRRSVGGEPGSAEAADRPGAGAGEFAQRGAGVFRRRAVHPLWQQARSPAARTGDPAGGLAGAVAL